MIERFGALARGVATAVFASAVFASTSVALLPASASADADIPAIARKVLPSVVSILVYANAEPSDDKDEAAADGTPRIVVRNGAGFVIGSRGRVLTNRHLVAGSYSIRATLDDGQNCPATLLGIPPNGDVALLQLNCGRVLPAVSFADSDRLAIGQPVLAIGNPQGFGISLSAGVVSAMGRTLPGSDYLDFIQTDASVNPGNSGGPLFDLEGRVVGMNTVIFSAGGRGGSDGLGFAIPSNQLELVLRHLRDDGLFQHGWLGAKAQGLDDKMAEAFGLSDPYGAIIIAVEPSSPAEKAGLQPGDIVRTIDGATVHNAVSLNRIISGKQGPITVAVIRNGDPRTVEPAIVSTETRPVDAIRGKTPLFRNGRDLGVTFSNGEKAPGAPDGALIETVREQSAADTSQMAKGDVILQVGASPVRSASDFEGAMADAIRRGVERVVVLLWSQNVGKHYTALPVHASRMDGAAELR